MSTLAKFALIGALAFGVQLMPAASSSAYAQQQSKSHTLSVVTSKDFCRLKPGETTTVDINIQKQKVTDKIEMNIKTTPLMVRTIADSDDANGMNHHATLQITAPENIPYKNYKVVVTTTDGKGKPTKSKLSFLVGNGIDDSSVDFNIAAVSFGFISENDNGRLLYLQGIGFAGTPKVIVNGKDISDKVVSADNNIIDLRGANKEDFNLIQAEHEIYANEIIIVVDNKVTNTMILNLYPADVEVIE